MIIKKDSVVSVSYELRNSKEGEIVEKTQPTNPLTFLFGHDNMLPKFEENINGLKLGDKFEFNLSAIDAYGEFSQEAVLDIPKTVFAPDGNLNENEIFIGRQITMQDKSGQRFNGVVLDIQAETVKMDFNHPMAGQELFFKGEVVEIREATAEEIQHGHIHQHNHNHGGCGCGNNDGGDCSSKKENCEDDDCGCGC